MDVRLARSAAMRGRLLASALLLGWCGAQAPGAAHERFNVEVGGSQRSYLLHVPASLSEPAPLVLALHGRGGSAAGMASFSGFDEVADEHGFLVAYPEGVDREWNYLFDVNPAAGGRDDAQFLLALADDVGRRLAVDRSRIYVAGFSNGGFMAQSLACRHPEAFAAFASVGATGFGGMPELCRRPQPLAMLLMHGSLDPVVPWAGQQAELQGRSILLSVSAPLTYAFWANHAGCGAQGGSVALPQSGRSPGTEVVVVEAAPCPEGAEVLLYAVLGAGHTWPGAELAFPPGAGAVNLDIDAAETIWGFFERHALGGRQTLP